MATLGNAEENDSISHALARLSEVEEKVEDLHSQQVRKVVREVMCLCLVIHY